MLTLVEPSRIEYLVGSEGVVTKIQSGKARRILDDNILDFLSLLSENLLKRDDIRNYPDIVSYAFWIRKKNLQLIKKEHCSDEIIRLGRGMVFHVAPSNIPVQFAITLTMGLLTGNINVVRVSNKEFHEVNVICEEINKLLNSKFPELEPYIVIIRYGHDDDITEYFSEMCNVRMIWGGDNTINSIKRISSGARTIDMCFADRYSFAVINSDAILKTNNIMGVAKDFYADTYYVDQNACSSPMAIIWTGSQIDKAKERFWNSVESLLDKYELSQIAGSEKLLSFCLYSMNHPGSKRIAVDNKLVRIQVNQIDEDMLTKKCNKGYFFEYSSEDLEQIIPLMGTKCQTVTVYGVEKDLIANIVLKYGLRGVDRIVNMGQALGIDVIWDGYDLISNLSRIVSY